MLWNNGYNKITAYTKVWLQQARLVKWTAWLQRGWRELWHVTCWRNYRVPRTFNLVTLIFVGGGRGWGLNVDCTFGPNLVVDCRRNYVKTCRLWSLFDPTKFVDCVEWWLFFWNSSAIHTMGTTFSKPNTLAKYKIGQHKVRLCFSLCLNIFLL